MTDTTPTPQLVTGSLRDKIRRWMVTHPGPHRCVEIAQGIGERTQPVALACWGMANERGDLVRGERPAVKPGGRPFKTYAAADHLADTVNQA